MNELDRVFRYCSEIAWINTRLVTILVFKNLKKPKQTKTKINKTKTKGDSVSMLSQQFKTTFKHLII